MRIDRCGGIRRTGQSVVRAFPNARKAFARSGWQKMEGEKVGTFGLLIFCQQGFIGAHRPRGR